MGGKKKEKSKAPAAPAFQASKIYNGDQLVGETYKDPVQGIITKYYEDPAEAERKKQAQSQINSILPTLGQTAPEMSAQYDQIANAYQDQATQAFDRLYNPRLKDLREDIGSRFGTLKATPYFDTLNDLETNVRTPALLDIANTAQQQKQSMYNNQEAQKLQRLQALGYLLNSDQTAFLQNVQAPQNSSIAGNNFNQSNYLQQLQQYNLNRQQQSQGNNALLGLVGGLIR